MSVLTKEKWVSVKYQDIEYPEYEVSILGRARKTRKGKTKYINKKPNTRKSMCLTKNKKSISAPLARVILSSFYNVIFTRSLVADHINNLPYDDRICNLQLITQSDNVIKDLPPHKNVKYKNGEKKFSPKNLIKYPKNARY